MLSLKSLLPILPFFISSIQAHGIVHGISVNGQYHRGAFPWDTKSETPGWPAQNKDYGFVTVDNSGSDMNCHKSAVPGKLYIQANAGDSVNFHWSDWPTVHMGPVIDYIANCNGECTSVDKTKLEWVKIQAQGLISPPATQYNGQRGIWATDTILKNNLTSTLNLPKSLKAGNYVIRHELIALHAAQNVNGAQFYPQCVNFKIGGNGATTLPKGTLGTNLYKSSDPGVHFNPWNVFSKYEIPGPAVWDQASSGGSPAPASVVAASSPSTPSPAANQPSAKSSPTVMASVPAAGNAVAVKSSAATPTTMTTLVSQPAADNNQIRTVYVTVDGNGSTVDAQAGAAPTPGSSQQSPYCGRRAYRNHQA